VSALFHEGERAVQRRAGAERAAAQVGRNILSFVPAEFGGFLSRQPFVVVASQDLRGRVWASLIAGGVGSARALDDRQVLLAGRPAPADRWKAPLTGRQRRSACWRSSSAPGSGSASTAQLSVPATGFC
jgi:predicted pyridoxine 5'-phosphate oxidase superfamily flavin-nucleotide-binding protein